MSKPMELQVVCSRELRKASTTAIQDTTTWKVDSARSFEDDVNFPRLLQTLYINIPCELCFFHEGIIGDVVDLKKRPDELGFRPRMAVYLRTVTQSGEGLALFKGVTLTIEDERVFRKLRALIVPAMKPTDPCPFCTRIESGDTSRGGLMSSSTSIRQPVHVEQAIPKAAGIRPEVGVQCGEAGRIGRGSIPVAFGTAARIQPQSDGPKGSDAHFPMPTTLGGRVAFSDFNEGLVTLQGDVDRLQFEHRRLAAELREALQQKNALEQWKAQHRCDSTGEAAQLAAQLEQLQQHLRTMSRGREEVAALLYQRRTSGLPPNDVPPPSFSTVRDYIPQSRDIKSLLDLTDINREDSEQRDPSVTSAIVAASSSPAVVNRRPSGYTTHPQEPMGARVQPAGQCMLRVTSVSGTFFVKRKLESRAIHGVNAVVLYSLDGLMTDEIVASELEGASAVGETGLLLRSTRNSWEIHLPPAERQRWLDWVYAINPWVSAGSP